VSLIINPPSGQAVVESIGARPLDKVARYVLSVDSSPVNGGLPERFFRTASPGRPRPPSGARSCYVPRKEGSRFSAKAAAASR